MNKKTTRKKEIVWTEIVLRIFHFPIKNNKQQVGLVKFIVILDNNGKRLYSRYFVEEKNPLNEHSNQIELENKIALSVNNLNVAKNAERKIKLFY